MTHSKDNPKTPRFTIDTTIPIERYLAISDKLGHLRQQHRHLQRLYLEAREWRQARYALHQDKLKQLKITLDRYHQITNRLFLCLIIMLLLNGYNIFFK